jgi:hypothetical protein
MKNVVFMLPGFTITLRTPTGKSFLDMGLPWKSYLKMSPLGLILY